MRKLLIFLFLLSQGLFSQEYIHLEWTPPNDPNYTLIDYRMYRDIQAGTMVYLDNVAGLDSFYYDYQITEGETYYWKVTAVYHDDSLNVLESGPSNEVSTTVTRIVGEDNDGDKSYDLSQNYLNPFNPITTIEYSIAKNTSVTIVVYDMLGNKVRVLVDESKDIGHYKIRWDGRNDNGEQVSSGVYFYQMTTTYFRDTKKLVLQR